MPPDDPAEVNQVAPTASADAALAGAGDDWVARAVAGEPAAQQRLIRQQWSLVEGMLARMLGPRGDLEDLVQTVFIETVRALPRFRGDSKLSTFVGGITVRVAMRAMRARGRAPRMVPLPAELGSAEPGPERRAAAGQQLQQVRAMLERLSEVKRVAFLLWALEGMPVEEIAQLMDASVPATRSRIFHAQKELRARAAKDPELRALIGAGDD
jgi:RNA polymerase sigma-70 factor (ECF subfamily)